MSPSREGSNWSARRVAPPLITPSSDPSLGTNINGPSVIRAPEWLEGRLGNYYMYFASHTGGAIRLAYSDEIERGWRIYPQAVLHLDNTGFIDHIASPDVHVDEDTGTIRMYFHGLHRRAGWEQRTRLALSAHGLDFTVNNALLGAPYLRAFEWDGIWHAIAMPGIFSRSVDGITSFEEGPHLFNEAMRHSAVLLEGDVLNVFYSNAGDCPESILVSQIPLGPDWHNWSASQPELVLAPELPYEGGNLEARPSERGAVNHPVRQLRDPFVFTEADSTWLFYAIAGEHGIALARLQRA